jgi:prevent-host-death family protein
MTITQVKAQLLSLMDEVEAGDEIEVTRHGVTIARIAPAKGPHALKGKFSGTVVIASPDDDLYSTGETWNAQ